MLGILLDANAWMAKLYKLRLLTSLLVIQNFVYRIMAAHATMVANSNFQSSSTKVIRSDPEF